jgi:hypothetical protein
MQALILALVLLSGCLTEVVEPTDVVEPDDFFTTLAKQVEAYCEANPHISCGHVWQLHHGCRRQPRYVPGRLRTSRTCGSRPPRGMS